MCPVAISYYNTYNESRFNYAFTTLTNRLLKVVFVNELQNSHVITT